MRNKSIIFLIVSFIISCGIILIYQFDNFKVKKVNTTKVEFAESDNEQFLMNISSISEGTDYIEIDGYALEKGAVTEYFNWVLGKGEGVYNNNKVVLMDENNNYYEVNTISQEQPDVNSETNDNINYAKCGFKALVKCKKLKKDETYKVGVIITTADKDEILVMSDKEIKL